MIYHILTKTEWSLAKSSGRYEPESLVAEGFIHCCTEETFAQVANFYFKGRPELVLLEIDETRLAKPVQWEPVGEHKFPHIYGALDVSAVVRVADIVTDADGIFQFPFRPVLH